MNQQTYLEFLLNAIVKNELLDTHLIKNELFKKLKPFHKTMLWLKACESQSVFYEQFFSKELTPTDKDLKDAFNTIIKNPKSNIEFLTHFIEQYPYFLITENQQYIVYFPTEVWNLLYPKTILNPSKVSHSLHILFNEPEKNQDKINYFIDLQKKGLIFSHPEMYYLMMFFSYMEDNSERKRTYFSEAHAVFKRHPIKITEKHILTAKIIHSHFSNIFDFIKPEVIKKSYEAQSFNKIIINEDDFSNFIQFISSHLSKEKLEEKLKTTDVKVKKNKI